MEVVLVAAIGENGELGRNNELLWHLPGDLPRFKAMTMGSPIIMGRKTYDSIGRALPGRKNIVITNNSSWSAENVTAVSSLDAALDESSTAGTGKTFVIGGGQIYKLFMPYANTLELTEVFATTVADTFFPNFSNVEFMEVERLKNTDHNPAFDYVTYKRV